MLNNVYRDSMSNHPYGYALYEAESPLVLRPASLGYLKDSRWMPLIGNDGVGINLSDPDILLKHDLTPFDNLTHAPDDERSWGPKTSVGVDGKKIDIRANASLIPAGIPANVEALYSFHSEVESGAILLTQDPVTRHAVYGERAFKDWCRKNSSRITSRWPDVKDHGLVIVTSTYTTARSDINAWKDSRKSVSIGFQTSAVEVAEIAPSSEWYTASSDNGWITFKGSDAKQQFVVFFGGLFFKYSKLAKFIGSQQLTSAPLHKLRGSKEDDADFDAHIGDETYHVTCDKIGDDGSEPILVSKNEEQDEDQDIEF